MRKEKKILREKKKERKKKLSEMNWKGRKGKEKVGMRRLDVFPTLSHELTLTEESLRMIKRNILEKLS